MIADRLDYEALPGRVLFGCGRIRELSAEVDRVGGQRVLLIDGLRRSDVLAGVIDGLGHRHARTVAKILQHVPVQLVRQACEAATAARADCLVAIGGGSATGLAKAVALETALPIIAVPSTYAGSEMTPIWGLTSDGVKRTGSSLRALPRSVIYDPDLTVSLPPHVTAASGFNALAHCVEALWTEAANPVTDAIATEAMRLLAGGLRYAVRRPNDLDARARALQGAWLAGSALAVGGTALHHRICHVLGGTFNLPHADVHAAVLPWVVDHFRAAAPDAVGRVAEVLDAENPVEGLLELADDLGVSAGLGQLGLGSGDLDRAAALSAAQAPARPAPVSPADVRAILENAMPSRSAEITTRLEIRHG